MGYFSEISTLGIVEIFQNLSDHKTEEQNVYTICCGYL